jgi:hypothetical protein
VILSLGAWRVYGLVEDGVEHESRRRYPPMTIPTTVRGAERFHGT